MRKVKAKVDSNGMRSEYDFSGAVRGKYYDRYRASTNVVVLDPDVSARARVPVAKRTSRSRGGRTSG
jgi:hypothetical protein